MTRRRKKTLKRRSRIVMICIHASSFYQEPRRSSTTMAPPKAPLTPWMMDRPARPTAPRIIGILLATTDAGATSATPLLRSSISLCPNQRVKSRCLGWKRRSLKEQPLVTPTTMLKILSTRPSTRRAPLHMIRRAPHCTIRARMSTLRIYTSRAGTLTAARVGMRWCL